VRARAQEGLVSSRQCHDHGLTDQQVARLVRRKAWERVARGVFDTGLDGPSPLDPYDRRRRRTAILGALAHHGSVVTGVCALVLHGVKGAPVEIAAEVTFPDGTPRRSAKPVQVRRLPLRRWNVVDGFGCATVEDALAQAVPGLDRRHAVAMMDSASNQGLITEAAFRRAQRASRGRRGARSAARWWSESDSRAESPAETWARLSCIDLGCPPDTLQLRVVDERGAFLARVDLAWFLPDGGALLVEGRDVHSRLDALYSDRRRQNRLAHRRTIVLRFSGSDAWDGTVGRTVKQVLDEERWKPDPGREGRAFILGA
jgi:hypothetical protein